MLDFGCALSDTTENSNATFGKSDPTLNELWRWNVDKRWVTVSFKTAPLLYYYPGWAARVNWDEQVDDEKKCLLVFPL